MDTIPVTVLGPSGSGKTLYLASLFRRLAIQRPDTGFFVNVPGADKIRLNNIFRDVAAGAPDVWPDPSLQAETTEWTFTCSLRTEDDAVFSPFALSYLDYSGAFLQIADAWETEEGQAVWDRVRASRFLLLLLDGEKVLRQLDGEPGLTDELIAILNEIQQTDAAVHVVVTKWDLLQAAGHTLRSVLDGLLEHPDFEAFYLDRLNRKSVGTFRFIPVSALGQGYAALDPASRTMVKQVKPGTYPRPYNVEIPFMAVLVDLVRDELRASARRAETAGPLLEQHRQRLERMDGWDGKLSLLRSVLGARPARSPLLRAVQQDVLGAAESYGKSRIAERRQQVEQEIAQVRGQMLQARSADEALTRMAEVFDAVLAEFEAVHPGSLVLKEAS
ncbi:hypothetical protein [Streptomyces sp. GbtcB6]|uniref:hypothetical protein n=1 Tax=Streptomyces sp. GbtcB6 TaxID=2824751 RepID=UPI001C301723|nr:hypothetical protein [Streptomyces sp. GbtcB6]